MIFFPLFGLHDNIIERKTTQTNKPTLLIFYNIKTQILLNGSSINWYFESTKKKGVKKEQ